MKKLKGKRKLPVDRKINVQTPEEVHLGLYKRADDESRTEATIVPRKIRIARKETNKEVIQLCGMVNFVIDQNKARGESNKIELQCTTSVVEKLVRTKLGKERCKHVRFLPPKVDSIRGQHEYGT